jgi:hypothetical protein
MSGGNPLGGLIINTQALSEPTQASVYNATFSGISGAEAYVQAILNGCYSSTGTFDPTNSNQVILLQIATQQLQAIVTASSNTLKAIFTAASSVIANI